MPYRDKEKQRAYQNQWMKNRRLQWIATQGGKCVKCGSKEALEVDHIDRAEKVSHRVWSWCRIKRMAELAKCQVLCIECHLEKTVQESSTAEHGSPSKYNNGCRCDECKYGHMLAMRGWRESVKLRKLADKYDK